MDRCAYMAGVYNLVSATGKEVDWSAESPRSVILSAPCIVSQDSKRGGSRLHADGATLEVGLDDDNPVDDVDDEDATGGGMRFERATGGDDVAEIVEGMEAVKKEQYQKYSEFDACI